MVITLDKLASRLAICLSHRRVHYAVVVFAPPAQNSIGFLCIFTLHFQAEQRKKLVTFFRVYY